MKVVKRRVLKIAEYIISELKDQGAYMGNKSVTTNSVYVKFLNRHVKSLTIRDHNTREKYKYKWNLRLDKRNDYELIDCGIKRYFYGQDSVDKLIAHIRAYAKKVEENKQNGSGGAIVEYDGNLLAFQRYSAIIHQVNCRGVMGAGLALQIKNKFPRTFDEYKRICVEHSYAKANQLMGKTLRTTDGDKTIFNMFSQLDYGFGKVQTNYEKMEEALKKIAEYCRENKIGTIGIPKNLGCGLAGGKWKIVRDIINKSFKYTNTIVYIVNYDVEIDPPTKMF